jgi:hypothetical protein
VRFDGAELNPEIVGGEQLAGVANFISGGQQGRWQTGVPTFDGVRYRNLYPGIDLRYNGFDGALKSTFTVAPGANPGAIQWRYRGVGKPQLDGAGNLVVTIPVTVTQTLTGTVGVSPGDNPATDVLEETAEITATTDPAVQGNPAAARQEVRTITIIEQAPVAWQELDGVYRPVDVRFEVAQNGKVSFVLGAYDPLLPLTIDPVLSYGTYLGGSLDEMGWAIDVDTAGNTYIAGFTDSVDFPSGTGNNPAGRDGFVAKLNAAGSALLYSSYVGGAGDDVFKDITITGAAGSEKAWVAGFSTSTSFPMTAGAVQPSNRGEGDGIIARLSAAGVLEFATFAGGSETDDILAIEVDGSGNVYVAGYTYYSGPRNLDSQSGAGSVE